MRPDFFEVNFLEVGAFHEAFGDCIAILTALGDLETRQKLLAVTTDLRKRNFVESTAEDLSNGHPAAATQSQCCGAASRVQHVQVPDSDDASQPTAVRGR